MTNRLRRMARIRTIHVILALAAYVLASGFVNLAEPVAFLFFGLGTGLAAVAFLFQLRLERFQRAVRTHPAGKGRMI